MACEPEVLVLASAEVGQRLGQSLAKASIPHRVLDLLRPVYRPYRFDPEAWDGLVIGSIHAWRGLDPQGVFSGPCFVVGDRTATRLREEARDLLSGPLEVPTEARAEGLVALIRAHFGPAIEGARLLMPRTDRGRTVLQEALGAVALVEAPSVYSMDFQRWPRAEKDLEGAWAVVFGSGEILRQVVDRAGVDRLSGRRLFVFGPAGLEAAAALGLRAEAPERPSAESVAAMVADRRGSK